MQFVDKQVMRLPKLPEVATADDADSAYIFPSALIGRLPPNLQANRRPRKMLFTFKI